MTIIANSLTVSTKILNDGTKIQNIFAVGEDNKLYEWSWKKGEWVLYAKAIEQDNDE